MRFMYFTATILIYTVYTLALLCDLVLPFMLSVIHRMYSTSKESKRSDLRFLVAVIHRRLTTQ